MAKIEFGGVMEEVITSEEFPLEKAREVLSNETVAVLGYGVQGPGQALNMRDNGIEVIIGQREGGKSWARAVADLIAAKTIRRRSWHAWMICSRRVPICVIHLWYGWRRSLTCCRSIFSS